MSETTTAPALPNDGETEREFLVRLGLAKPTRGRFGKDAIAALDAAKAAGATFRAAKPVAKPRVAKAAAPVAEGDAAAPVARKATPGPVAAAPAPVAPVTRREGQAWGFTRVLGRGRKG